MDKKNIMNEHNFNYSIKERIQNRKEWVNYFSECLKHFEVNEKVSREFYKDKPVLRCVLGIYFMPIKLIKFYEKSRTKHYYFKCRKEIEIIKEEMKENKKESIL